MIMAISNRVFDIQTMIVMMKGIYSITLTKKVYKEVYEL